MQFKVKVNTDYILLQSEATENVDKVLIRAEGLGLGAKMLTEELFRKETQDFYHTWKALKGLT